MLSHETNITLTVITLKQYKVIHMTSQFNSTLNNHYPPEKYNIHNDHSNHWLVQSKKTLRMSQLLVQVLNLSGDQEQ